MDKYLHLIAVVLSIAGTIWLLIELARTRKLSGLANTNLDNLDVIGVGANAMRDAIAGQFRSQLPGFSLLLIGQIIDLIASLC